MLIYSTAKNEVRGPHYTTETVTDVIYRGILSHSRRNLATPSVKAIFTQYRIPLSLARKPNQLEPLFTNRNRHFDPIAVTEQSCATRISKLERRISDKFHFTLWCFYECQRSTQHALGSIPGGIMHPRSGTTCLML